ncbi:hypothetical protein STANM309S_00698 [Streptomyces tanashiensis]
MPTADVLICTRTAGYRHDSIPAGAAALAELARELGTGGRDHRRSGRPDPRAARPVRRRRPAVHDRERPGARGAHRPRGVPPGRRLAPRGARRRQRRTGLALLRRTARHPLRRPPRDPAGPRPRGHPRPPVDRPAPGPLVLDRRVVQLRRPTRGPPASGSWPGPTSPRTGAAPTATTTRSSGAGRSTGAASSSPRSDTPRRPTSTRRSGPTSPGPGLAHRLTPPPGRAGRSPHRRAPVAPTPRERKVAGGGR